MAIAQSTGNAGIDAASFIANMFTGKTTTTTNVGSVPANNDLQSIIDTANMNANNPDITNNIVNNIMREAQISFAPQLATMKQAGLYNSTAISGLASDAAARATGAAAQSVLNFKTSQEQIATNAADTLAKTNSKQIQETKPPSKLGTALQLGAAGVSLFKGAKSIKDFLTDPNAAVEKALETFGFGPGVDAAAGIPGGASSSVGGADTAFAIDQAGGADAFAGSDAITPFASDVSTADVGTIEAANFSSPFGELAAIPDQSATIADTAAPLAAPDSGTIAGDVAGAVPTAAVGSDAASIAAANAGVDTSALATTIPDTLGGFTPGTAIPADAVDQVAAASTPAYTGPPSSSFSPYIWQDYGGGGESAGSGANVLNPDWVNAYIGENPDKFAGISSYSNAGQFLDASGNVIGDASSIAAGGADATALATEIPDALGAFTPGLDIATNAADQVGTAFAGADLAGAGAAGAEALSALGAGAEAADAGVLTASAIGAADAGADAAAAAAATALAWIVCTELNRQNKLPRSHYVAGAKRFEEYSNVAKQAYYIWAIPARKLLREKPNSLVSRSLSVIMRNRTEYLAAKNGSKDAETTLVGLASTVGVHVFTTILGLLLFWRIDWTGKKDLSYAR